MSKTRGKRITILLMFIFVALTGCEKEDDRPRVSSDPTPFSIANVYLGMRKQSAESVTSIGSCSQKNEKTVECATYPKSHEKRILFMGSDISSITYSLNDSNSQIYSIKFHTIGHNLSQQSIEARWNLEGRCIDYSSMRKIESWSTDGQIVAKHMWDWRVSPIASGDFICMSEEGNFISVSKGDHDGEKYAIVDIFNIAELPGRFITSAIEIIQVIEAKNNSLR